eukprot:CAMPEP_0201500984 /NCGR_PEP_ID=MMETSP0151_2-20130828/83347_1 /ASSEMBLY_ACC=CAM_ASM_000257 /TAXON_ID=200890 /ORGANISM="Paramoeba atlantica, Strain 621/1 / CCAP 1560/9" /LENGTH=188 /DNA_ID=CAMNT_0047894459 /DNA_START=139 /DNA_END=705 /DNA_ORIENTATION=+
MSNLCQEPYPLPSLTYIQKPTNLSSKGKVKVIELWATWCGPCEASTPHLSDLADKYPDADFVGITNEPESKAKRFLSKMGSKMRYSVACDENHETDQYLRDAGGGIPAAFIISKKGKVVWKGHPMSPEMDQVLNTEYQKAYFELSELTREKLSEMKVKDLKAVAREVGANLHGCIEKGEIVDKIVAAL